MTTSFQACADLRFIFQCQVFQYKTNKRVRHALGKDLQLNSSLNGETRLYTNNNTYIHISYTTLLHILPIIMLEHPVSIYLTEFNL